MQEINLYNFLKISITTYFITVFVFAFWAALTQQSSQSWDGSLAYLPHGCKVICICFFGYMAIPALFLAEFTGQVLEWPNTDMTFLYAGSISSILSVVLAVEIIERTQIAHFKMSNIFLEINFINYKFILITIILSALFNSIFTNLVFSQIAQMPIGVSTIFTFFIGDIIGSLMFITFAIITLRLILSDKNKTQ